MSNTVKAYPAKRFFVGMLTRDIELQDAILDLLDNCVDGALRLNQTNPPQDQSKPYAGRVAKITFNKDEFTISDNCGGIPRDLAENYAFRLGRPDTERDASIATVGMYGIGMKRAIFKMGRASVVSSQFRDERFSVNITAEWMEDDDVWTLPISVEDLNLPADGTVINITSLHESISHLFSTDKTDFEEKFKKYITAHYSFIIEKGFKVIVNGENIESKTVGLMFDSSNKGISPYLYEGNINGVEVNLIIGIYRTLPSEDETEDEIQGTTKKENAGWTVVCNDRVVLYCDKTRLTGWGEAGVPNYHSQFIAISGIVVFKSNDAANLPVTTTKRGIDHSSQTYLIVKDIMRDGLKHFTSFTNRWKSPSPERDELQGKSKSIAALDISSSIADTAWKSVKKDYGEGRRFVPELPSPTTENPQKQIRFSRKLSDIEAVAGYLFDDKSTSPNLVGEECFDSVLRKAK